MDDILQKNKTELNKRHKKVKCFGTEISGYLEFKPKQYSVSYFNSW